VKSKRRLTNKERQLKDNKPGLGGCGGHTEIKTSGAEELGGKLSDLMEKKGHRRGTVSTVRHENGTKEGNREKGRFHHQCRKNNETASVGKKRAKDLRGKVPKERGCARKGKTPGKGGVTAESQKRKKRGAKRTEHGCGDAEKKTYKPTGMAH